MKIGIEKYKIDHVVNMIEMGDVKRLKEYLESNKDLINKIHTDQDWTPMMFACRYGNMDIIKFLRQVGFTIDKSSVHTAIHGEDNSLFRYLQLQTDLNQKDVKEMLRYACIYRRKSFCFCYILENPFIMYHVGSGDNKADPGRTIYYNLYPQEVEHQQEEYFNSETNTLIADVNDLLKIPNPNPNTNDQRDNREMLVSLLGKAKRWLLDFSIELSVNPEKYHCNPPVQESNTSGQEMIIEEDRPANHDLDVVLRHLHKNTMALEYVYKYI